MITFDCALARPGFTLDACFECPQGVLGLFGPSGSGKSTILRLIAGLERPDRGRITLAGETLVDTSRRQFLPPHKRRTGLVFQDGQLLPHLDVRRNLAYGRHFSRAETELVGFDAVVDLLGLGHLLGRSPAALSGGERQRVAIGRALLASPRILLLDEPLAALDRARKLEVLPFIERLRDEVKLPIVYVSHAVEEMARLASHVVRIDEGKVRSAGSAREVLSPSPAEGDRFEAVSVLTGTIASHRDDYDVTILSHPAGEIVLPGRLAAPLHTPIRLAIRATNIALALTRPSGLSIRTALAGRVEAITQATEGPLALVSVELEGGDRVEAFATRLALADLALSPGAPVYALVKAVSIDERGVAPATKDR